MTGPLNSGPAAGHRASPGLRWRPWPRCAAMARPCSIFPTAEDTRWHDCVSRCVRRSFPWGVDQHAVAMNRSTSATRRAWC